MPLAIELLTKPMTPSETPGLDVLDPRFQEIAGLAEQGDFAKAAEQTQALLQSDVVDVRVLSYFLYGAFLERGLQGLEDVLKGLLGLLGPNWPAVGPLNKKDKHTENGLSWFLNRLMNRLEDEAPDPGKQKPAGANWAKWTDGVDGAKVKSLLERVNEVKNALQQVAPSPKVLSLVAKLQEWLAVFERLVAVAAPPPPEPTPEPVKEEAPAAAAPAAAPRAAAGAPAGPPPANFVEGSWRLEELMAKMSAFEALVRKKDFAKASIVAADISETVEHFDPRLFFPKLFAKFYALSFQHLEALEPQMANRETPSWKAMERLYRVDLDAFAK